MGTHYSQLNLKERVMIDLLVQEGHSLNCIAAKLGRATSTVSRELKRNAKPTKQWSGGYEPERAHVLALRRRRWDARFKLARQPELRQLVYDRLAMGWSPEQIAGRLALENAPMRISPESIYRFVYHKTAQQDWWHRLLPQQKHRRGWLRRHKRRPLNYLKHRTSIHHRSQPASQREEPGHWEADLMLFKKYGQAVLVTHERTSRYTLLTKQPSKHARPVVRAISRILRPLPAQMRRSITFDNGTEFFLHHKLRKPLSVQTYFCDPWAPWQKGGIENAIGRIRRSLPSKTDLAKLTNSAIKRVIDMYNNTPRKCLGFKTPHEAFHDRINQSVALQT